MNLHTLNLVLRLRNPPRWVARDARAPLLINELNRSGFFQQEVNRTNISRRRRYFMKAVQIIQFALIIGLFFGCRYFYDQNCEETKIFHYIAPTPKVLPKEPQEEFHNYLRLVGNLVLGILAIPAVNLLCNGLRLFFK